MEELNDGELAKRLKRGRRWIYDARARGAPAGNDEAEWRAWMEANPPSRGTEAQPADLKKQKTLEEIRKLKIQNDLRDERLKDAWRTAGREAMLAEAHKLRVALYGLLPDRLAARLAADPVTVRKELEACLDELIPAEVPHG
jgi:hypothetical protein